jgi:hypothetical protein
VSFPSAVVLVTSRLRRNDKLYTTNPIATIMCR